MKLYAVQRPVTDAGRAPHGARGLKHGGGIAPLGGGESRPARGAWIETSRRTKMRNTHMSRPARGAWIETAIVDAVRTAIRVAPRTGRVD